MEIIMGPVLSFRGYAGGKWKVSCLFVTDGDMLPISYKVAGQPARNSEKTLLTDYKGRKVWRHDMDVTLGDQPIKVAYSIGADGQSWSFTAPKKDAIPKVSYVSCNGFSEPKAMKKVKDKNFLWKDMAERHDIDAYHILAMGGDQVYADQIWESAALIKAWAEQPEAKKVAAKFTDKMKEQVQKFYFDLYCQRWAQAEVQKMLSTVPTVMMWDDHDIFDGWGSHPEELQGCEVFQGIFALAKEYFQIFQLQVKATEKHPAAIAAKGFSLGFVVGQLSILTLDMRSERTNNQVISAETWKDVYLWLDGPAKKQAEHLYVMSSIPVVHPDFGLIEGMLGVFPGQQELEDDLRDHWHSRGHRAERLRLIHRSLAFAENARVTILSGDVHVGALGIVQSQRNKDAKPRGQVLNQFTSSGIVHPAPPAVVLLSLKLLSSVEDVDQGITAQLINFPGSKHSFIGSRNWLSLEPDNDNRIWANWFVESEILSKNPPFTKVVHPL